MIQFMWKIHPESMTIYINKKEEGVVNQELKTHDGGAGSAPRKF
ncbi:hypothetical protein F442_22564 [Phytophthora nicotianae P10297]|uniref:Uncharacterized protein n=5 Tax=Phytophthora nicotianae TaxID=4792 RepID=V9FA19_PHYNI|nr:hypothetical protein F443_07670 [Phytophthora nicotianae P1569]ETK88231.1 hypothetical protein L915_07493 [Phytophthora nicotianae]ETO70816.1 hypothetical protein F444_12751 [Phytophthora nicotianae P1976]ETP28149.1 hypothetical protein F442_22564 [Phytophthora nicotianae P10297]ETL41637.1 hypothetical protein L916_07431 [Phytophthora nicotianae]